jgi:hypothetical protein
MSLLAGISNEYESKVDPGIKHSDTRIYVGLNFDF